MLIPSIDLMGGKVVQLVHGEKKALEFDSPDEWIARFRDYPLVQVIDLDAAISGGNNAALLQRITSALPCQVGGGIRTVEKAKEVLASGARRVIIGSSLFGPAFASGVNAGFAADLSEQCGLERLVFAIDSRAGRVAVKGWRESTALTPEAAIAALDPYTSGFLYTHIDTEGTLSGFPMERAFALQRCTSRHLTVAGGIRSREEIDELSAAGIDAVVGMAIYTHLLRA